MGTVHAEETGDPLITIVETASFVGDAKKLFNDGELEELKLVVALNPDAGNLIEGTGGVRKLRVALGSRGKSAGARLIYYYRNSDMPIFFLAVYAKNEKINISAAERNTIKLLVRELVGKYRKR